MTKIMHYTFVELCSPSGKHGMLLEIKQLTSRQKAPFCLFSGRIDPEYPFSSCKDVLESIWRLYATLFMANVPVPRRPLNISSLSGCKNVLHATRLEETQ